MQWVDQKQIARRCFSCALVYTVNIAARYVMFPFRTNLTKQPVMESKADSLGECVLVGRCLGGAV